VEGHTQEADLWTSVIGLSYERACDCVAFGVAVAGGVSLWENDRYVENNTAPNGFEVAHSDPEGIFFTAKAHFSCYFPCSWGSPTLYGDVRYAGLFLGDYSERGSSGNFAVKERNVDLLTARLVLEPGLLSSCSRCSFVPFVGVVGRHQLRGDDVEGKLNGVALTFSQNDSRSSIAGLLGVRVMGTAAGMQWSISFEGTVDSESGTRLLSHLGAERSF
jgi:hypothetical protein